MTVYNRIGCVNILKYSSGHWCGNLFYSKSELINKILLNDFRLVLNPTERFKCASFFALKKGQWVKCQNPKEIMNLQKSKLWFQEHDMYRHRFNFHGVGFILPPKYNDGSIHPLPLIQFRVTEEGLHYHIVISWVSLPSCDRRATLGEAIRMSQGQR